MTEFPQEQVQPAPIYNEIRLQICRDNLSQALKMAEIIVEWKDPHLRGEMIQEINILLVDTFSLYQTSTKGTEHGYKPLVID